MERRRRRTSFRSRIYRAVEHGVIPLDGSDVFQHGGIDSIGDGVAPAESETFPGADASAGPVSGLIRTQRDTNLPSNPYPASSRWIAPLPTHSLGLAKNGRSTVASDASITDSPESPPYASR
jgi:hypothetical protein